VRRRLRAHRAPVRVGVRGVGGGGRGVDDFGLVSDWKDRVFVCIIRAPSSECRNDGRVVDCSQLKRL